MKITLIYFSRNAQPVASAAPICRESLMKTCMICDHSWMHTEFISKYFLYTLVVVNVDESVTNIFRVNFFKFNVLFFFNKKNYKS